MTVPERIHIDDLSATIIRTQRKKTIGIKVDQGEVSLIAPRYTPIELLEALLLKKRHWVKEKIQQQQSLPTPVEKRYCQGDAFLMMGETLHLCLQEATTRQVIQQQEQLIVALPSRYHTPTTVRRYIEKWYRQRATDYLTQRTQQLCKPLMRCPSSIQVRSYKRRWGSCNAKGDIKYNWQLIMAPVEVIDYVIIHELCHLYHLNHSPLFWQLVADTLPDYQQHQQWLKQHGHLLAL